MRYWLQHLGQICKKPSGARLAGASGDGTMVDASDPKARTDYSSHYLHFFQYTQPSTRSSALHLHLSPFNAAARRPPQTTQLHRLYVQNPSQDPATPPTQFRKSGSARPPAYIKVWPFISLSRSLPSQFKDGRQDDLSQDDDRLPRLQGQGGQCTRLGRVSAGWEGGGWEKVE
jgi:hypothetical protein